MHGACSQGLDGPMRSRHPSWARGAWAHLMRFSIVLIAWALALAPGFAPAQPVKVGVVDVLRIERESVTATRALKALDAEMAPRAREVKAFQQKVESERRRLESEKDKLPRDAREAKSREIAEMMRRSNRMVEGLAETYDHRRREVRARVVDEARAAIKVVAEAGKYDLVLMSASYVRPSIDITPLVLKEMARRAER